MVVISYRVSEGRGAGLPQTGYFDGVIEKEQAAKRQVVLDGVLATRNRRGEATRQLTGKKTGTHTPGCPSQPCAPAPPLTAARGARHEGLLSRCNKRRGKGARPVRADQGAGDVVARTPRGPVFNGGAVLGPLDASRWEGSGGQGNPARAYGYGGWLHGYRAHVAGCRPEAYAPALPNGAACDHCGQLAAFRQGLCRSCLNHLASRGTLPALPGEAVAVPAGVL